MKLKTLLLMVATAAVAVAEITSCPKYCTCNIDGISGITAVCTQLNPAEQMFVDIVQHLKVEADPKVPFALTDFIFTKLNLVKLESLKIVNTNLTNISEHAFDGLSSLNDINLSNNQLFLLHPDTFASTKNLHRLKLSGNPLQLTLFLPNTQSYFLRSASLTDLDISSCELPQIFPKTFSELKNLIFLNLSNNFLKTIPKGAFDEVTSLEELDLSSNSISKIDKDQFKCNTELSCLKLHHNPIESLSGLNISSLDELDLSYCKLKILMKETLEGMPIATIVNLSSNQISVISDDTFNSLAELKKLDLSYNKLMGPLPKDLFKENKNLDVLILSGNRELRSLVDETGFLEHHSAMQRLEIADCNLTQLTGAELRGMDDLNILNVSNNAIRDIDQSTFKHLSRLNTLDLSNNKLLSLSIHLFSGNPELVKLKLSGNPLNCLSRRLFAPTPAMKYLELRSCNLARLFAEPDAAGANEEAAAPTPVLSRLVHLDLSENELRTLRKVDFDGMKSLEVVDVKGNPLECIDSTIHTINSFDERQIEPYRTYLVDSDKVITQRSLAANSHWDKVVDQICEGRARRISEIVKPKVTSEKVPLEVSHKLNRLVQTHIAKRPPQPPSFAKVEEVVVEADNGLVSVMWPLVLVFSILVIVLYLIVYLVGEISQRRSLTAPYNRPGLGGHVKSRDSSGSPLYYKLYGECSVPAKPEQKKNYVLDFSPIHTILKKSAPAYKIMKNSTEANV